MGCSMKPTFQPQASPSMSSVASPLVNMGSPGTGCTTVFFL
ncbi:Uncharacterised protein [Bordetella pertussis]|nr:Uncharacterised protein [Bordetella pertussis]